MQGWAQSYLNQDEGVHYRNGQSRILDAGQPLEFSVHLDPQTATKIKILVSLPNSIAVGQARLEILAADGRRLRAQQYINQHFTHLNSTWRLSSPNNPVTFAPPIDLSQPLPHSNNHIPAMTGSHISKSARIHEDITPGPVIIRFVPSFPA